MGTLNTAACLCACSSCMSKWKVIRSLKLAERFHKTCLWWRSFEAKSCPKVIVICLLRNSHVVVIHIQCTLCKAISIGNNAPYLNLWWLGIGVLTDIRMAGYGGYPDTIRQLVVKYDIRISEFKLPFCWHKVACTQNKQRFSSLTTFTVICY